MFAHRVRQVLLELFERLVLPADPSGERLHRVGTLAMLVLQPGQTVRELLFFFDLAGTDGQDDRHLANRMFADLVVDLFVADVRLGAQADESVKGLLKGLGAPQAPGHDLDGRGFSRVECRAKLTERSDPVGHSALGLGIDYLRHEKARCGGLRCIGNHEFDIHRCGGSIRASRRGK